jgi:adenosylcobinamide-phosphate synthase
MSSAYYPILSSLSPALYLPTALLTALLLDRIFGEPKRWHPLVGFGWLAMQIERYANRPMSALKARFSGFCAWLLLLVPFTGISYWASHGFAPVSWLVETALLYFALGARSLQQHAERIATPLAQHNLIDARHAVSMIVSRDCDQLNESEIATASVESVLENGNDAIFAAIFWFVLLGGSGAVLFRLANTLDAMWGYRTPRFLYFGWAAARLDDLLNLIPARLTALTYALCGHTRSALHCWRAQAHTWYSPNAGPVMAAGAGALRVKLGGAAVYHGQTKMRPTLGLGANADHRHILASLQLVKRSIILWCATILLCSVLWSVYA